MITNTCTEQEFIQPMMETLKRQMRSVDGTQNSYAYNAQLMAIATQSLTVELALLNLLKAWKNNKEEYPWHALDIGYWKKFLNDFNFYYEWYEMWLDTQYLPSEFDISSTLFVHHTRKEREDGRDYYNIKTDGLWNNNANMLNEVLADLSYMDTDYAFEVACDAITQLALTFVELETILKEHNYQKAEQLIAQRPKAGRKASSCFLSETPVEQLSSAFHLFYKYIATDNDQVSLGNRTFDRKYLFVLFYYLLIRKGLAFRKVNVHAYSQFIHQALGMEEKLPSFRKSMNNWMQKIDLYGCTFDELTVEKIRNERYHDQQLTEEQFHLWRYANQWMETAIEESEAFKDIF